MLGATMSVAKDQHVRYEPLDILSEGATSVVELARDHLMDRLVAIKTVKLGGTDDSDQRQRLVESLESEAQVVQLLSHPNIVHLFDVLESDGIEPPKLVLEYVQGTTLESFLKAGKPLPLDFALLLVIQIGGALEHAHSMGVVHGDIKPANILISDSTEQAKLVDFGIASVLSPGEHGTVRPMGTPKYVAPEVLLGQAPDPRSDLFSMTVVLYEMLTGRSPFEGNTSEEIARQIASGSADLSDSALVEVPESLRCVLEKGLERNPRSRFQSARELLDAMHDPTKIESSTDMAKTQDLTDLVELVTPTAADDPESANEGHADEPRAEDSAPRRSTRAQTLLAAQNPIRMVVTALATALIGVAIALTIHGWLEPNGPPDGTFSKAHMTRTRIFPLLQESRRQYLAGDPELAVRILLRAESLAPERQSLATLRKQILLQSERQRSRDTVEEDEPDPEIERDQLPPASRPDPKTSPTAPSTTVASRKTETTPFAQTTDGQGPKPISSPDSSIQQSSEPATDARQRLSSSPAATPSPMATSSAGPRDIAMRVDVFSYLPKGVLTIYSDQDQVLLQPFRFVQKNGFLRKKKTAGRLETSITVPTGDSEFRIYVSAEGQETQSIQLTAKLSTESTPVLRLIIDENGAPSAQLN